MPARSASLIHCTVAKPSRPISTPKTMSGTITIKPITRVAAAAAVVRFHWPRRLRSNRGQIAIATTTAHANAGRKSQMIQVPIARRAKMSANWPKRRDDGEPAELAIESGRAGPPDGDLDGDGSRISATNALFDPSIPAPIRQHYHLPGRRAARDLHPHITEGRASGQR